MSREALIERFFNALISGQRSSSRAVVDELLQADISADSIMSQLFWPTLEHIQKLFRNDQMTDMAHHLSTRMLRHLADQMQLRLEQQDRNGKSAMVLCGPEESEELGAQMAADLLEAQGYEVYFVGGGVANDEIVAQLGQLNNDLLVVFGAVPSTVPFTRLLIDRLHDIGVCPKLQIVVGGGVFNRAEGLAEEIGADLWAATPAELCQTIAENPGRRMTEDQRTVGRKRKNTRQSEAA